MASGLYQPFIACSVLEDQSATVADQEQVEATVFVKTVVRGIVLCYHSFPSLCVEHVLTLQGIRLSPRHRTEDFYSLMWMPIL